MYCEICLLLGYVRPSPASWTLFLSALCALRLGGSSWLDYVRPKSAVYSKMAEDWCLIESDPGVFTEMIKGFGTLTLQIVHIVSNVEALV